MAGGRELVGGVALGKECRGWEYIWAGELLGERLEGGSWKGGWQQEDHAAVGNTLREGGLLVKRMEGESWKEGWKKERYVEGENRLAWVVCSSSSWWAVAGRGEGNRKAIQQLGVKFGGRATWRAAGWRQLKGGVGPESKCRGW